MKKLLKKTETLREEVEKLLEEMVVWLVSLPLMVIIILVATTIVAYWYYLKVKHWIKKYFSITCDKIKSVTNYIPTPQVFAFPSSSIVYHKNGKKTEHPHQKEDI
ncbi:MAG: hypothetical protein ABEJ24_05435 [Candidatus Magasanikbacteria bacterium]